MNETEEYFAKKDGSIHPNIKPISIERIDTCKIKQMCIVGFNVDVVYQCISCITVNPSLVSWIRVAGAAPEILSCRIFISPSVISDPLHLGLGQVSVFFISFFLDSRSIGWVPTKQKARICQDMSGPKRNP